MIGVSAALLVIVALTCAVSLAPVAAADPPGLFDIVCAGKPPGYIVKNYTERDGTQDPLRCGNNTFGYVQIRDAHGFTENTDQTIATAVTTYQSVRNDSSTAITYFALAQLNGYRVSIQQKAYDDGYAQGVVTAYQ